MKTPIFVTPSCFVIAAAHDDFGLSRLARLVHAMSVGRTQLQSMTLAMIGPLKTHGNHPVENLAVFFSP